MRTLLDPRESAGGKISSVDCVGRRRRLAIAVFMSAAILLGLTSVAAPASAATTYGLAKACFKTSQYGQFTGYYSAPWTRPVNVEYAWNNTAYHSTQVTPNGYGCVSVWVQVGYYWRFTVDTTLYSVRWTGSSTWKYIGGYYTYDYGTVTVSGY